MPDDLPSPTTLFGLPLVLEPADAASLRSALATLWMTLASTGTGTLEDDLKILARYWHPRLRGATLRDRISHLSSDVTPEAPFLREPLLLRVDDLRAVISVEGRLVLGLLPTEPTEPVVLTTSQVSAANATAARVYSEWAGFRIRDVARLLQGEGPPLLPPVLALLVLLLVNRSTTRRRGISGRREEKEFEELDLALRDALVEFADLIAPVGRGRRDPAHFSLYGGYLLSEASRRLGTDLVRDKERIYISDGSEDQVIELVAQNIARRDKVTLAQFCEAFDTLVERLRGPVGRLALHDSYHEVAAETAKLRAMLVARIGAARGQATER